MFGLTAVVGQSIGQGQYFSGDHRLTDRPTVLGFLLIGLVTAEIDWPITPEEVYAPARVDRQQG